MNNDLVANTPNTSPLLAENTYIHLSSFNDSADAHFKFSMGLIAVGIATILLPPAVLLSDNEYIQLQALNSFIPLALNVFVAVMSGCSSRRDQQLANSQLVILDRLNDDETSSVVAVNNDSEGNHKNQADIKNQLYAETKSQPKDYETSSVVAVNNDPEGNHKNQADIENQFDSETKNQHNWF